MCAETADMDCTVCSIVIATAASAGGLPLLRRDAKEPVASNFSMILFNEEDVIGLLRSRIPFMKRYARNVAMALSEFL